MNKNLDLTKRYWDAIPIGKANAVSYSTLMSMWNVSARHVRQILNELSMYEDGSNYILIRSSKGQGFYKTDDIKEIESFRRECLNRGRACLAPIHKMNKVLKIQYEGGFDLFTALEQVEAQETT